MSDEEVQASFDRLVGYLRDSKPLYAIQALVSRNSKVLERVDGHNWTLLYYACNNAATSFEVMNFLVQVCPKNVLCARDGIGLTPLHYACYCNPSFDSINVLVQQGPDAVGVLDTSNRTPLHRACIHSNVSLQVVELLVEKYSEALGIQDKWGRTPLYYSCYYGATKNVIEHLVNHGPAVACLLQDDDEKLPLDRAEVRQNTKDGVIDFLTGATKEAACGLIDAIWKGKNTLPWMLVAHVMETMSTTVTNIDAKGEKTVMNETARLQLDIATVKAIVKNAEVQALLKRDDFRTLVVWERCGTKTTEPQDSTVPVIHAVPQDC